MYVCTYAMTSGKGLPGSSETARPYPLHKSVPFLLLAITARR